MNIASVSSYRHIFYTRQDSSTTTNTHTHSAPFPTHSRAPPSDCESAADDKGEQTTRRTRPPSPSTRPLRPRPRPALLGLRIRPETDPTRADNDRARADHARRDRRRARGPRATPGPERTAAGENPKDRHRGGATAGRHVPDGPAGRPGCPVRHSRPARPPRTAEPQTRSSFPTQATPHQTRRLVRDSPHRRPARPPTRGRPGQAHRGPLTTMRGGFVALRPWRTGKPLRMQPVLTHPGQFPSLRTRPRRGNIRPRTAPPSGRRTPAPGRSPRTWTRFG
jgi:hypothetical protein